MSQTDGASDEGAQLQTAMQHIDQLHNTLGQALAGFDAIYAQHDAPAAPADDHDTADLQQEVDQLHQLAQTIAAEIGQKLTAAIEGMHAQTTQMLQTSQEHAQEWDQTHDALKAATTALEQVLDQAAHGATTTLGELQSGLEQATHSTTDLIANLEKSATSIHTELSDTVTSTLKGAASEFHDGIANAVTGKLTEHISSAFSSGKDALGNLEQSATHIAQDFGHEAESALQNFAHELADGIKNQLEAAGEKLAKDAMEMLSSKVAASIAEGTAGTAITGAMAPILPEVIIVKEASEAIKDLISVFKAVASVF
jgi:hypothetical protein